MDQTHSTTNFTERKRGQHLGAEERGAIQALKKQGFSNRAIARTINCSPSTVGYELLRSTLEYSGRRPGYSARRGATAYKANRRRCHRFRSVPRKSEFICWMVNMVLEHNWSFDICVGRGESLSGCRRTNFWVA